MKRFRTAPTLAAVIVLVFVAACSKTPARKNPCDLLSVDEAQSIESGITQAKWSPGKEGEAKELCTYSDSSGEAHLMLFVFHDKSADPFMAIQTGMRDGANRFVQVVGVGEAAAAGFNSGDDTLKVFLARSQAGMIGIRVRFPVREDDDKFNDIERVAAKALGRLK